MAAVVGLHCARPAPSCSSFHGLCTHGSSPVFPLVVCIILQRTLYYDRAGHGTLPAQ